MTIDEIKTLIDAETILFGDNYDSCVINSAYASDMMSDVLAQVKGTPILITGLCNPQVIRTADMMDIACILFVRGKKPDENCMMLASDTGVCILATKLAMFETCGILYKEGLLGGPTHE